VDPDPQNRLNLLKKEKRCLCFKHHAGGRHGWSGFAEQSKKQMHQAESRSFMKKSMTAAIGLMGFICLLAGCAEVAVPGAMTGGAEYYHYTASNVANETLMGDVRDVTTAARSALNKMGIRLHSVAPYTDKTVIFASTAGLDININMIPVTASATRVIVDAR